MMTLGCAKNTVQSQVTAGVLEDAGYELVDEAFDADLIIINTCGFITAAKEESIAAILDAAQLKYEGFAKKIVVMGCMVQKYSEELMKDLPEVDLWLGTSTQQDLLKALDEFDFKKPQTLVDHQWSLASQDAYLRRRVDNQYPYSYLAIAEGCNNLCTFCSIPEMTGPYRSRPIEDIVSEAEQLVAQGFKELILIAQDTSYYGKDLYGTYSLASLLEKLAEINELVWIRVLYSYPNNFTDDLINLIAREEKICAYLDIPIQHGADGVLSEMNRNITVQEIEDLISKLREEVPRMVIRSTFITGFPGESEGAFQDLLDFLQRNQLERVGVFPYSQEDGTPAGRRTDQIPLSIREERAEKLMSIQTEIMFQFHQSRIGEEVLVIIDELSPDDPDLLFCRSYAEAPEVDPLILVWTKDKSFAPGDFIKVRLTDCLEYDLVGEIINECP